MSIKQTNLVTATALRQAWLDERLRAVEAKLKIDAPPAPCPDPDIGYAGQTMLRHQKELTDEAARAPRGGGPRALYPAVA